MATYVITAQQVNFGGVDLTDHVEACTVEVEADKVVSTNFGSGGWDANLGGIKRYTLNITFQQDFASSSAYATVFGGSSVVANLGTSKAWNVRPTSSATGATNPAFSGNVIMTGGTVLGGTIGELAKFQVSLPGTGALAVATS